MLTFRKIGGFLGVGGPINYCPRPGGEYLQNYTFDCGTRYWGFDPKYPATITDNGDGSVHLKADSNFGSLVPDVFPTHNDSWVITAKVRNQVGATWGKISIQKPNLQWDTVEFGSMDDGVYTNTYNGVIVGIHVGANGDETFEADFDYVSLKKV